MIPATSLKKILILAVNPLNTSRLRLDQEVREITTGLQRAKNRDLFSLEQRWAVRSRDVRQSLLEVEPEIVHFCGHGESNGCLYFENEVGQPQLVTPEALAELFGFCPYIKCVILNACYSSVQAEAISKYIDYVIGMNQSIGDKAAIEFTSGFYDALGVGRQIEEAHKIGCNAIALAGISEYLTPVLKIKGAKRSEVLPIHWNNEAYVSLHLVQKVLERADLPSRGTNSHWYPQFKIKMSNFNNKGILRETLKPVDFFIEDTQRNLNFLVEVKTANNRIDDNARFQLRMYLQHSGIKLGFLIDPFLVEAYQWHQGSSILKSSYDIKDPEEVQPVSDFVRSFLDFITDADNCNSHI